MMLQLKYKIWIDDEGKIFGKGPYQLLKGVKEKGSLSESAKNLNMSYNKAFNLIKDIENRLGYKLILTKSGGSKGGGSSITEDAEALMEKYDAFIKECNESLNLIFEKHFIL
jgi:molybdate transport system regulatory protein